MSESPEGAGTKGGVCLSNMWSQSKMHPNSGISFNIAKLARSSERGFNKAYKQIGTQSLVQFKISGETNSYGLLDMRMQWFFLTGPRDVAIQNILKHVCRSVVIERKDASSELKHADAEGPPVYRVGIRASFANHFWGYVVRRTFKNAVKRTFTKITSSLFYSPRMRSVEKVGHLLVLFLHALVFTLLKGVCL